MQAKYPPKIYASLLQDWNSDIYTGRNMGNCYGREQWGLTEAHQSARVAMVPTSSFQRYDANSGAAAGYWYGWDAVVCACWMPNAEIYSAAVRVLHEAFHR